MNIIITTTSRNPCMFCTACVFSLTSSRGSCRRFLPLRHVKYNTLNTYMCIITHQQLQCRFFYSCTSRSHVEQILVWAYMYLTWLCVCKEREKCLEKCMGFSLQTILLTKTQQTQRGFIGKNVVCKSNSVVQKTGFVCGPHVVWGIVKMMRLEL